MGALAKAAGGAALVLIGLPTLALLTSWANGSLRVKLRTVRRYNDGTEETWERRWSASPETNEPQK